MPLQFARLQKEFDENRDWIDKALALINKFLTDNRFYMDQMSKTFLRQYNVQGFEMRKDFIRDIEQIKEQLNEQLQEFEQKSAEIINKFKHAEPEDLKALRDEYVACDKEIERIKFLLAKEVKSDMVKSYMQDKHLTDAQIIQHVHHYAAADCNRSPLGKLAALTEEYYREYLEKTPVEKLTVHGKILQKTLETVANINSCAATAVRATRVTTTMESETEERKIFIEHCLLLTQSCLKHLTTLAGLMSKQINEYYKNHQEVIELAHLKEKEGRVARPDIEIMLLVNEQQEKLQNFRQQLKSIENGQAIVANEQKINNKSKSALTV